MGKRAVYPGMFDPMHNGHLDLIERSLRIFDELIVAVVANPSKEPLFTVKERLEMIDECTTGIGMSRMRMTSFDGLLIDLVDREGADCIVRGLRAVSDFEYEFQMSNPKTAAMITVTPAPVPNIQYVVVLALNSCVVNTSTSSRCPASAARSRSRSTPGAAFTSRNTV